MKYSLIVFAMIAALATGTMAKDAAGAAGAAPAKKEMTADQKAAHTAKMLEKIKSKDEALYKELVALKEKDPAAFDAKMAELRAKHRAEAKAKGGAKKACKDAAK